MSEIPESEFKVKYREASDPMHQKVEDAIKEKGGSEFWVYYSAYESDPDGIPIDNLDVIPMAGKVKVVEDNFFGSGKCYSSKVLENPTWLDLCVVANEMILATGDKHHIYLEGIMATPKTLFQDNDTIKIVRLVMGPCWRLHRKKAKS
jgi:hypothetical protein